ncbi:MAG: hemerythrin domain-containing protein [Actinomycetota bacterium]|nr:hemerythrin domain-containing protein [Actinomycetota bacterium]
MASSVVTVIKEQHREVDKLVKQVEAEKGDVAATLQKIYDMLKPHSDAEEDFVYPSIEKVEPETGEEVHDGTAEHHHFLGLLTELLNQEPGGPGFDGAVAAFAAELRHHVEEEEADLLPALQENMSRSDLEAMGERFVKATTG